MTEEEWDQAVAWWLLAEAEADIPHGFYSWRSTAARVACLERLGQHLPTPVRHWLAVVQRFLDHEVRDAEADIPNHEEDAVVDGLVTAFAEATGEWRERYAAAYDTFRASGDGTLGDPGDATYQEESTAHGALIRDIFGNPFRPVTFAPDWRTSTAVAIAKGMYESRDFSAMPILADALQDAGCDSDDILNHCRDESQVHVRGCWVCDLVLGKA
jgi:hypothetical protein